MTEIERRRKKMECDLQNRTNLNHVHIFSRQMMAKCGASLMATQYTIEREKNWHTVFPVPPLIFKLKQLIPSLHQYKCLNLIRQTENK